MFNLSKTGDGEYTLEYFGSKWVIRIFECKKRKNVLDEEVKVLEEHIKGVFAVIPANAVSSPLSLMIGALMFCTNASLTSRFRNKGLVLSRLITGQKQLYETIGLLRGRYVENDSYYLTIIHSYGVNMAPPEECKPVDIDHSMKNVNVDVLKNIYGLISAL